MVVIDKFSQFDLIIVQFKSIYVNTKYNQIQNQNNYFMVAYLT